MAYFGKVFVLEKTENFEDFIKSLGLPQDKTEKYLLDAKNSTQKLDKDGDGYILLTNFGGKSTETKFKSGVEYEESLNPYVVTKNVMTVDGNKVTHVQKFNDGKAVTYVREYSADRIEMTITSTFWSGTAKQFYVAQ